ncbi:APC family permease [Streptomyces sp. BH106]|uniref:APC family permease n=1 Tax=Streptomyces sp. BH106 TaxID=3410409 RepID=UPI003CF905C5
MSDATTRGAARPSAEAGSPSEAADVGGGVSPRTGTAGLVLTVLAYVAPLTGAAGYVTLVIAYGNGLGAPLMFPAAGLVLLVFAVGYTAMVRRLPRPGAFYAYISAGLGKRLGLGAGAVTAAYYLLGGISGYFFGSVATQNLMKNELGIDLPWWTYLAAFVAVVTFCSYRGVDFNVRVVGTIVCVEILIIAAFNVVTLFRGGPTGHPSEPLTWDAFTSGPIAVAALYTINLFAGFESTAIYREEVRDPARTIPRATYILVILLSLFYAVTAWCLIAALGTDKAVDATAANPAAAFTTALSHSLSQGVGQLISALLVTSLLASQITIANASTRYLYSFGVDRVLPRSIAAIHPRHGSPHRAALANAAVTVAVVVVIAVLGTAPKVVYVVFGGVLIFALEALMLLVSLAVFVYFRRNADLGESVWKVVVAPLVSAACLAWLLYSTATHADLLLGTGPIPVLTPILFGVVALTFVAGFGYACWQAVRCPEKYGRIGRETTN